MGKITGFLEIKRELPKRRPVAERIHDWQEVYQPFEAEKLKKQGARCMDCGIPFCHQGCPLGNLIPDWNDLVYRDHWREAIDRLHATNNFPEFTGRLCPAPCEGSCVLGINDDPVTIKQIEVGIIEHAFDEGWVVRGRARSAHGQEGGRRRLRPGRPRRRRAAQSRRARRHRLREVRPHRRAAPLRHSRVQDGEARPRPAPPAHGGRGGRLRDRGQRRRDACPWRRCAGTSTPSSSPAAQSGRATCPSRGGISTASTSPWTTSPCRTTARRATRWRSDDFISARDKHVIIIGGGDTGADCLGTVHRQGARSVTQFEILPRPPDERDPRSNPWPLWPNIFRVSSAHEEGGAREYSINTTHFSGADGRVSTLHAVRVEMVTEAGRTSFRPDSRYRDYELAADLVLLAMGFLGPRREGLLTDLGVKLTDRGNVWRDANWMTSVPGVFAAGDMQRGQSLIVWAIAEGRSAARGVDLYLMGKSDLPAPLR